MTPPSKVVSSKVVSAAIIGAGGISQRHYDGFRQAGVNVVAIADASETIRGLREKEWGARAYASFEDLLEHEDVQAISVCTPNAYHAPATIAALEAGIHVLCEKPLSMSLDECDAMIGAARESGAVLQTGHHLRSSPLARTAKRLIDEGRIGRVTFMRLRQAHDWSGAPQVHGAFGSREASGGGTLLDNGCHMMDLARYFGGDVQNIYVRMNTLKFEIEVEDVSVASLQLESGALASVENAWTATGWEESFHIYGTEGALECNNRLGKPRLRFVNREFGYGAWEKVDETWYDFATSDNGHVRSVGHFISSIEQGTPVICTGEDGRESVRLVLGGYESARTGLPVNLKE